MEILEADTFAGIIRNNKFCPELQFRHKTDFFPSVQECVHCEIVRFFSVVLTSVNIDQVVTVRFVCNGSQSILLMGAACQDFSNDITFAFLAKNFVFACYNYMFCEGHSLHYIPL